MNRGVLMRNYILFLTLVLIIIISGCQTTTNTPPTGTFIGGVEGVGISFVNLAPPSQFTQNDNVRLKVLLMMPAESPKCKECASFIFSL